jgi:hypothetical protein
LREGRENKERRDLKLVYLVSFLGAQIGPNWQKEHTVGVSLIVLASGTGGIT